MFYIWVCKTLCWAEALTTVILHLTIQHSETPAMNKVVYIHRRATDGVVFYVGIGNPARPFSRANRTTFWERVVSKYGYTVEVLSTGLKIAQAIELEVLLIAEYGRRDLGLGTLVNLTDGGDGTVGYVASDELRKKRSEAITGDKHHFYGKKRPEHAEKVRGQKRPDVTKKLRNGANGKAKLCPTVVKFIKSLYKIQVDNGKKWGAVARIARQFNISHTCIYDICVRKRCWNYETE